MHGDADALGWCECDVVDRDTRRQRLVLILSLIARAFLYLARLELVYLLWWPSVRRDKGLHNLVPEHECPDEAHKVSEENEQRDILDPGEFEHLRSARDVRDVLGGKLEVHLESEGGGRGARLPQWRHSVADS